jgi:hypothetical protein
MARYWIVTAHSWLFTKFYKVWIGFLVFILSSEHDVGTQINTIGSMQSFKELGLHCRMDMST